MKRLYRFDLTGKLARLYDDLPDDETRDVFYQHFVYGTPSTTLSRVLREHGFDISETTIKEQRRRNMIGT